MRAIAFLAAVLSCGVVVGQKMPDVRLDTDPAGAAASFFPKIAASGSSVYVTWFDHRKAPVGYHSDIYFNRSLDGGATWETSDVQLNTSPPGVQVYAGDPKIAASGSSVYVTWYEDRSRGYVNDIYFNRSLDGGSTWLSQDRRLDTDPPGAAGSFFPKIAASGSSVYVTWYDDRNGRSDIYFNYSADRGATWLASDVRLDTDPSGAATSQGPQIAVSGSAVYVLWHDDRNSSSDIYLNRSVDNGATWLASDVRLNNGNTGMFPQVVASGSSVCATWHGSNRVYSACSTDGGVTWHPNVHLNMGTTGAFPQIAAVGSSVYVTWQGGNRIHLRRSTDGGITWHPRTELDTDPTAAAQSTSPRIAASGSSVCVTWYDGRNGADDIYFNRSLDGGRTWLASDLRLDTDPPGARTSFHADVAASGASAYVAWYDSRNGLFDIYFNIPFGFQPYGAATPGSGNLAPVLGSTGSATIGGMPSIDVTSGLGGAAGALFVGGPASRVAQPVLGGTLLVFPTLSIPIGLGGAAGVPGAGTGSFPLLIPNTESIIGVNINFQGIILDAGAAQGISMTNGVEMWIG